MSTGKPQTANHSTRSRSLGLSPKESRDLLFLHSILIDQMDWLLANLNQIVIDSDGDLISSWLHRFLTDTSDEVKPLPDSLWNGCLADYRAQRDQIFEQWWLENMGVRPSSDFQPVFDQLFSPGVES